MKVARIALGVAALAVGAAWWLAGTNVVSQVTGLALFTLVAACIAVENFAANLWLELTAIFGILLILMDAKLMVLGGAMLAPGTLYVVGRLWKGLQDEVIAVAHKKGRESS